MDIKKNKEGPLTKALYLRLFGLALFIFILYKINITETLVYFSKANKLLFFSAFFLAIPLVFFKAYRWKIILSNLGHKFSLLHLFKFYFIGFAFGFITPGRLGEFSKVYYLKKQKDISISDSFFSVLLDRILDIFFLFVLLVFALFYFSSKISFNMFIVLLLVAIIFFSFFIILFMLKDSRKIIIIFLLRLSSFFINLILPKRYKKADFLSKINNHIKSFFYSFFKTTSLLFAKTIFLTLLAWLVYYVEIYVLAFSLHIKVPFLFIVASLSLSAIITLIPISFSGLGTRDALLIYLFSLYNYLPEQALSLSFSVFFIYIFNSIVGLVFFMMYKPEQKKAVYNNLNKN